MIEWQDSGVVLSVRSHGETGGVASILTKEHGRAAGYVYGVGSSRLRGVLEPGNVVSVHWQAKARNQLGSFTLEPDKSILADIIGDPLKMTVLQSACTLADKTLPEREKHENVFAGLCALMDSFATEYWAVAYIYWEIGLLRELGFGLDLSSCAATGSTEGLIYVSPRSGRAVSAAAGNIYKEKLLALPSFLKGEGGSGNADILEGLKLTGHFLLHRVFAQSNSNLPEPRLRLEEHFGRLLSAA